MVTVGVRVSVSVSVRVMTAFVLTLVPGSGMHLGLRFRSGFALLLRLGLELGVKCWCCYSDNHSAAR